MRDNGACIKWQRRWNDRANYSLAVKERERIIQDPIKKRGNYCATSGTQSDNGQDLQSVGQSRVGDLLVGYHRG